MLGVGYLMVVCCVIEGLCACLLHFGWFSWLCLVILTWLPGKIYGMSRVAGVIHGFHDSGLGTPSGPATLSSELLWRGQVVGRSVLALEGSDV